MLKIAIVGLPNAGKSTLFNRLVGRKAAVVSNIPGFTRDRREGIGRISDLEFKVIDTGGWNDQTNFSLQVIEQIKFSLSKEFAKWLKRKINKPVILIANKCESHKSENVDYLQFFDFLGPVYTSTEHNLGMVDLYDALADVIENLNENTDLLGNESSKLRIAIIGHPNVGKSTSLNLQKTE